MLHVVPAFARIGEENAFAVLARATDLARQGKDIINLGIGQPDFSTPAHIVEAAIKALRDGHHGYTPATGILPLREAIALAQQKDFSMVQALHEALQRPFDEQPGHADWCNFPPDWASQIQISCSS